VSFEDDAPPSLSPVLAAGASLEPEDAVPSDDDPAAAAFVRALLLEDRSFFAQPEPLKWTAGVENAFVSVPSAPQLGQNRGPESLIPWITSVTCRQFEQT
jgi:hypothetical protein